MGGFGEVVFNVVADTRFLRDYASLFRGIGKIEVVRELSDPLFGSRFSVGVVNEVVGDSAEGVPKRLLIDVLGHCILTYSKIKSIRRRPEKVELAK